LHYEQEDIFLREQNSNFRQKSLTIRRKAHQNICTRISFQDFENKRMLPQREQRIKSDDFGKTNDQTA
jgi:hypothetical protein